MEEKKYNGMLIKRSVQVRGNLDEVFAVPVVRNIMKYGDKKKEFIVVTSFHEIAMWNDYLCELEDGTWKVLSERAYIDLG